MNWLPAMEVLGEGIFVRLDGCAPRWEESAFAAQRTAALTEAVRRRDQESGHTTIEPPTPSFLAVHTFAHAVLKELSLDAGYPTGCSARAGLRRRSQAGFLIYTASSDAAGSLGGLAALAEEERFADGVQVGLIEVWVVLERSRLRGVRALRAATDSIWRRATPACCCPRPAASTGTSTWTASD